MTTRLRLDPISCDAHGICAELFPEWITLDEWGYPIIKAEPIPAHLREHAKRAVFACPVLALKLEQGDPERRLASRFQGSRANARDRR